ncbi:MAG: hypothetical protein R3E89_14880 [Thiolinea sp.]
MIYQTVDLTRKLVMTPAAKFCQMGMQIANSDSNPLKHTLLGRIHAASAESGYRLLKHYPKPDYGLDSVEIDGKTLPVTQEVVHDLPFGNLLRFRHEHSEGLPKVLFVAAMSGHYASLASTTYREFLADYDVYVTDWKNTRDIPQSAGRFGFDEYCLCDRVFAGHGSECPCRRHLSGGGARAGRRGGDGAGTG